MAGKEYYVSRCPNCGKELFFVLEDEPYKKFARIRCPNCGKENIIPLMEARQIIDKSKIKEIEESGKFQREIKQEIEKEENTEQFEEEFPKVLDLRPRTIKPTIASILLVGILLMNISIIGAILYGNDVTVRDAIPISFTKKCKESVKIEIGGKELKWQGYWGFNSLKVGSNNLKIFLFPFLKKDFEKISAKVSSVKNMEFYLYDMNTAIKENIIYTQVTPVVNNKYNLTIKDLNEKIGKLNNFKIHTNNKKILNFTIKIEIKNDTSHKKAIIKAKGKDFTLSSHPLIKINGNTKEWQSFKKEYGNYTLKNITISTDKNTSIKSLQIDNISYSKSFGRVKLNSFNIQGYTPFTFAMLLLFLIISLFILYGSINCEKREKLFWVIFASILGILCVGIYLFSAVLGLIALALVLSARDEFE